MRTLTVFNSVSLDGYFTDARNDMSWAHRNDPEWQEFTSGNASGGGTLLFGRVTYDMMKSFWPTPAAKQTMPDVADAMNKLQKVVFSRTMEKADWENTRLVKGDLVAEVRKLKEESGPGMVIMGSGTIIAQLTAAHLIDEYQIVVVPVILGAGRTMFEKVPERIELALTKTRSFVNGNVVSWYRKTT